MKKYITILGLVSFTLVQANTADDNTLNKFIGEKSTVNKTATTSTFKVVKEKNKYTTKVYHFKPANSNSNIHKRKTHFINYDRPDYIEVDKYKNYNKSDLSVDYKKQIAEENRLKDTL